MSDPDHDIRDRFPRRAWPRRKLRSEVADELFEAITMRNCPYYLTGREKCPNRCWEEPACVVNQPLDGWTDRGPDPKRKVQ